MGESDIIDEAIYHFKANIFFRNYEIKVSGLVGFETERQYILAAVKGPNPLSLYQAQLYDHAGTGTPCRNWHTTQELAHHTGTGTRRPILLGHST